MSGISDILDLFKRLSFDRFHLVRTAPAKKDLLKE